MVALSVSNKCVYQFCLKFKVGVLFYVLEALVLALALALTHLQTNYSGHWKGWSLQISTFLGPNGTRFAGCHFRTQKSLDFQSPVIPMALVMDITRIKSIKSRAI
jgi:hypothetical protein